MKGFGCRRGIEKEGELKLVLRPNRTHQQIAVTGEHLAFVSSYSVRETGQRPDG